MYEIVDFERGVRFKARDFDLEETLDCGQCFRWKKTFEDQSAKTFKGIVGDRVLEIVQRGDIFEIEKIDRSYFEETLVNYFDLSTDYELFKSSFAEDQIISKAIEYAGGIRILRQDPWEVICSFIISQNNNIARIKGIIDNLCKRYGEKISDDLYTFPSFEKLSNVDLEELMEIKAGFRCKYILDACRKIVSGQVEIDKISSLDIDQAREVLKRINGIGPKVADCILLFGFYRLDAFPIDVWIKRALDYFYPEGFPENLRERAGIAQQYLFHYIRTCETAIPPEYKKGGKKKN